MDERGVETDAAHLARTEKALRLTGRELKWWQIEFEHTTENLQRTRRQRAKLRQQVVSFSDVLATVLSERYWSTRPGPTGINRLLRRGHDTDPEAELVREVEAHELFDGGWYLRTYPKVAASGLSPAQHYVRHGNARRLDPGPRFRAADYLDAHPDTDGLPALLHAVRHGRLRAPRDTDEASSPARDMHL